MASTSKTKIKQKLLARAKSESTALAPYVKRALAKHARAGKKVYVVAGPRGSTSRIAET